MFGIVSSVDWPEIITDQFGRICDFFIDWTCSAGEECGATAEITQSLQIDLVLSDTAATSDL